MTSTERSVLYTLLLSVLPYLIASLLPLPTSAQVQTGTPPFGSYGGGPDVINLANLNSHITIPVFHKAGRGLPFNFDLSYDSSIWSPVKSGSTTSWVNSPNWGWGNTGGIPGYITFTSTLVRWCTNTADGSFSTAQKDQNWTYYDSTHTPHIFGQGFEVDVLYAAPSTGPCAGVPGTVVGMSNNGIATASDLSGYTLNVDWFFNVHLTSSDGTFFLVPINPTSAVTSGSLQDRNGNLMSFKNGAYTDTLGTTALYVVGTPASLLVDYELTTPALVANGSVTVDPGVTYKNYTVQTNFQISGIIDFPATTVPLVDRVTYADGSYYAFAYEVTPNFPSSVTGRLSSVRLPTGATITYQYDSSHDGLLLLDPQLYGSLTDSGLSGLTRTTPDGVWKYSRTPINGSGSIPTITTTITDPVGNQGVLTFSSICSGFCTPGIYEVQRDEYTGTAALGTLLRSTTTCFNSFDPTNPTNCIQSLSFPFNAPTQFTKITKLPGGLQSAHSEEHSAWGHPTVIADYDFGSGKPGALLRKTLTTYANLGNSIHAFKQTQTIQDGNGNPLSSTTYNYDQWNTVRSSGTPQHVSYNLGNLTSINYAVSGLTEKFTYFDTGTLQTSTDVNGAQTTNVYGTGSCGNSFLHP